jgi:hemolysin activation/secretion protein
MMLSAAAFLFLPALAGATGTPAAASASPAPAAQSQAGAAPAEPTLYIREYRVKGVHILTNEEVDNAVYPFLGPGRTREDVEKARQALEQAYQTKGYKTVSVQIPPQQVKKGVVMLQATEATVGRLSVNGSRYYSPDEIKKQAPSLAPGTVPDFSDNGAVAHDVLALNQLPDRRITPVLRAGELPGTVDIDLNVKDTSPLHGSVELNNRYSANTTPLRVDGSVSYANLWQAGHTAGFSFQLAPENLNDAEVFSAYYIARFPGVNWLSVMAQGTKQDSDISTLGGSDVVGKGETAALSAIINLPNGKNFYDSITLAINYKHYGQDLMLGGVDVSTPTTYYPLSASYNANWLGNGNSTELNANVTFNPRGLGSSLTELDNSRYMAGGNFIYLRGDLAHTHDLPGGLQAYGKIQGQVADQPLLNTEQISGGGLSTVRGYLESAELGDNGFFASAELRTPSLPGLFHDKVDDWRLYVFGDWGILTIIDALPEQQASFTLASFGVGTKMKISDHFNGSLDLGVPLIGQGTTKAYDPLLTFRVWAEF